MSTNKSLTAFILTCCIGIFYTASANAQATKTDSLAMYRVQIDSLDKQLIELLGKRMQVVENVGRYKAVHNIPALQKSRFDAILQKNIAMGKQYNLSDTLIVDVMNAIHKESLTKENAIAVEKTGGNR